VLGKNMHSLIHHKHADGTLLPVEECRTHWVILTGEGVHAEDEVFWRANGTSFPVEYWSYPQRRGHEVVRAVVAFIDITERKLAEAALANVSHKLIEAQEQERTRIGRELHDDIVQRLALLAIKLQQLQQSADLPPEARSQTGELWKQTTEVATDIQSLWHELHSSKLQYLGLAAARGVSAKNSASSRRWRLTSKPTICQALCRRTFLCASSEYYKKRSIIRQNTVGYGTSKCDCGEPRMKFSSRLAILV